MDIPARSLVYYALCELSDACVNINDLKLKVDSGLLSSYLDDVLSDIESAYSKLENISL